jgi:hypothetical protein
MYVKTFAFYLIPINIAFTACKLQKMQTVCEFCTRFKALQSLLRFLQSVCKKCNLFAKIAMVDWEALKRLFFVLRSIYILYNIK